MIAERRQYFFERNPRITLVFFILLVYLVLDGVLGLFLIPDGFQGFRTRHYYYHHGLRPGQATFARWNTEVYPFYTNSLGLRDAAPRKILRKTERKRLLIMGDSHTEGVDLPYEKTFAGILATAADSMNTEVFNAAVISYSPKIHYLKLKYLLEKEELEADEVFCLIDISDIQNELVYEKFNPKDFSVIKQGITAFREFLKRNSFTVYALNKITTDRGRIQFYDRIKDFDAASAEASRFNTSSADLYYSFFSHFNDRVLLSNPRFHGVGEWLYDDYFKSLAEKGIEQGQENIIKLKELCDSHGIKLTIAVHPWYSQIYRRNPEDEYVRQWKLFAEGHSIGFVNLFPLFINGENPEIVFSKYYIKGDNHWNEAGHARVADFLKEILLKKEAHE